MFGPKLKDLPPPPLFTYIRMHPVPYRCPVCEGRGTVPQGFYSDTYTTLTATAAPESCRTCDGHGLVWVGEDENA